MDKFIKRKVISKDCESTSSNSKQTTKPVNPSVKKVKVHHDRGYVDDYLKFGFSWTGSDKRPIPLCVVCGDTLSNESMVPSKLERHFTTKHSYLKNKGVSYFQRLLDQQTKQRSTFQKTLNVSERAQLASIEVAELIALKSKSHTLAESVILPACRRMVKCMLGEKAETEINKVPLSNDTIRRRISDLSTNIETKVQNLMKQSKFALIVDESTDISNSAQLLVFVRFIHGDEIINQFLCCKEMKTTCKGQDIFDVVTSYLEKNNLSWKSCIGICTDGAPCMVGSIKGFASLVQKENPEVIRTHCFLHREVLV